MQTLEEEARKFVAEKKIPTSHISAIVQAAMRKKEKALAARAKAQGTPKRPPKVKDRAGRGSEDPVTE